MLAAVRPPHVHSGGCAIAANPHRQPVCLLPRRSAARCCRCSANWRVSDGSRPCLRRPWSRVFAAAATVLLVKRDERRSTRARVRRHAVRLVAEKPWRSRAHDTGGDVCSRHGTRKIRIKRKKSLTDVAFCAHGTFGCTRRYRVGRGKCWLRIIRTKKDYHQIPQQRIARSLYRTTCGPRVCAGVFKVRNSVARRVIAAFFTNGMHWTR